MNIFRYQKIIQPNLCKAIKSLAIVRTKKTKSCEKRDCCGNLIEDCGIPDVVVERECHPPSFFTWKPKIPELKSQPFKRKKKKSKQTYKKEECIAGMKDEKFDEIKKHAQECAGICLQIPPICPPEGKLKPPGYPSRRLRTVPVADWDIDGHMD